jgi:hypothetical protein
MHTYVILEVPAEVYAKVRELLLAASYEHAIHKHVDVAEEIIDMHGIALKCEAEK